MFLADALLRSGREPGEIIDALQSGDSDFDELVKRYNPDQPRVPAGNGLTSGRWTTGDGLSDSPSAEVNPETVTPVGNTKGSYQGEDACYRARNDCQVNVRQASRMTRRGTCDILDTSFNVVWLRILASQ
jgi:hypothetical protein